MEKKRDQRDVKAIRFPKEEWAIVEALASKLGVSRSEFVKRAAMQEAARVLAGAAPQYVSGPKASTHTGGANTFSDAKQTEKRAPAGARRMGPTAGGQRAESIEAAATTNERAQAKRRDI